MKKIAFVDLTNHFYDRHSTYALSAVLKQRGFKVYYVRKHRAFRKLREIKPDLLLYSAFSSQMGDFKEFDAAIKRIIKTKSVIGGPGPTFDWKCLENSSIDAACIGEGEYALPDFIESGFKEAKNIFVKGGPWPAQFYPFAELDTLPLPDRDIVYDADTILRDAPTKQFLSGRGCPYECTYCFNHKFKDIFKGCGSPVRKKSVGYFIEEIRSIKQKYPLSNLIFHDDTFILDKKWFFEFCERFPREIGLTYICNVRANLIDSPVAKGLKESNCIAAYWSIESGNDFLRNTVLKRGMSKEQILNAADLLTQQKIPYKIANVIGLPGEKVEQMFETVELNIQAKPTLLGLANIFVPYPELALTEYAIKQGYYNPGDTPSLPKDFFRYSALNVSKAENETIQKLTCLFPLFVSYPRLFHNVKIRMALFALPRIVLKLAFEGISIVRLGRLFWRNGSFLQTCRMGLRYILQLI